MLTRPIFVVGTMRSGSTLLRLILDAHPHISISEETGFMGGLVAAKRIPNWMHGEGWYERLGWSEEEFDARLREFYSGLFERHAQAEGKQRWGDKTPMHSEHMPEMARIFPDAVFVAIVRHPGAVVHSLVRKFHYAVADAVTYWKSTNEEILRRGMELGNDRFVLLRYEDLVERPEETLRELVDFLDEPWSDDLLRHQDVQAAKGAPRVAAGSTRPRDAITTDLADRWATALAPADRELLVTAAGPLACFLGYDPGRPGVPGPLVPPGSGTWRRLLSGGVLAERQQGSGAVPLTGDAVPVVVPEMSPVELAKRLQKAERALARVHSSRAVRWSRAARQVQRRVSGVPGELRAAANQVVRGGRGRGPAG